MSERKSRPQLRVIVGSGVDAGLRRSDRLREKVPDPVRTAGDGAVSPMPERTADTPVQPGESASDGEEFCPRYYEGQHERRRVAADVDRLRYAIVDLAAIELPPARLLQEINPTFDRPIIRDRLLRAIDCLSQVVEEWRLEELTEAARSSRGARDGEES